MMNIFYPLNLPPLDEYMKFVFEIKKIPTTNRNDCGSHNGVQALGEYIRRELFNPTREENIATT